MRLTDTLEMRPHWTPKSDSFTSPPTPTMKPVITTARHAMVRELTLDPSITTLNMALNTIVSDLRTDGSIQEGAVQEGALEYGSRAAVPRIGKCGGMMYGIFGDTRNSRKGAVAVAATAATIDTPSEGGAGGNDAGYKMTRTDTYYMCKR